MEKDPIYADDATEKVSLLLKLRLPWLVVGLLGGIVVSLVVSSFENIISKNIGLAYFVPIITYLSDAVGTQTETIYVRNLVKKQISFYTYLLKELSLGVALGLIFGLAIGLFAYYWLNSFELALTVGLAMCINIIISPLMALLIPEILFKEHTDPALGAGPFTTVVQYLISLVVYFTIAVIIFGQI